MLDNIVLIMLFKFFKNTYKKKWIKICVILFKHKKTVDIFTLLNGT